MAKRRYAACDPDNWLIGAQLEKGWETALRRVEECHSRLELEPETRAMKQSVGSNDFVALAEDLETAWASPNVSMRVRQQLLRALATDFKGLPSDVASLNRIAHRLFMQSEWLSAYGVLRRKSAPRCRDRSSFYRSVMMMLALTVPTRVPRFPQRRASAMMRGELPRVESYHAGLV